MYDFEKEIAELRESRPDNGITMQSPTHPVAKEDGA
jgi:hypothetical protein